MTAATLPLWAAASSAPHAARLDGAWLVRSVRPAGLDRRAALALLPRQPGLAAPTKLVLTPEGGFELRAEVPHPDDGRAVSRERAERALSEALDRAERWAREGASDDPSGPGRAEGTPRDGSAEREGTSTEGSAEGEGTSTDGSAEAEAVQAEQRPEAAATERLAEALAELPFGFEAGPDGAWRAHVVVAGVAARLHALLHGSGGVRTWTETDVDVRGPDTPSALALYALACAARLRGARASIVPREGGSARVVWDAVVVAGIPWERGLPLACEAVLAARIAMGGAVRALTDPRIAAAFLEEAEDGAPRRP